MLAPHALLHVDLTALKANYRSLVARAEGAEVAPAVKADAYGLGIGPTATALWDAGARSFFVAQAQEAAILRAALPEARIFVLNGPLPGEVEALKAGRIIPMINSLEQLNLWTAAAEGQALATAIHLDSGMSRLGLPPAEVEALADAPRLLDKLEVVLVASHLASADDEASPQTAEQSRAFMDLAERLPEAARQAPRSLANSSGIGSPAAPNLDLVRPGFALYGGNPTPGRANPMRSVVRLEAPVLQVRQVGPGTAVGYNATYITNRPMRLATLAIGYADGYDRSLSNRGRVTFAGLSAPIVGRISMDLTTVDVTAIAESACRPGSLATLIGEDPSLDEVAAQADTIGYEILARMSPRLQRLHKED
ncbi:MAG: alanine racemase [Rhodospirillales bacterium]